MAVYRIAIGSPREASHPAAIRAAFAEFFSMLIFVFAGQGSGMAYTKLTKNGPATPDGLIVASLSHAFGLFVAVSVGANNSGGHVNPAVTFGAFVGGNITLLRNPKKGNVGVVAPIAIGFIVGANILVGGAFDGASMNPAVSFGPALVSWSWTHHWVYWLGPFIGSAAAAIIYDNIFIGDDAHQPLSSTDF
ncbi:unnamed protein product [Lupinus luteus]|uniref:Uncharacterized protein n=1 Tax=Lupinus luteus TaxID=3873 RepID=A0AAV1XHI5_LUPLU